MLAQSGLSFLIYLIIGVFWLIGQVAQQKKAKQRAEEMKKRRLEREERERRTGKKEPATKQTTIEAQLEDFLGRLAGEPAPPPPPPPPPPPQQKRIVRKNAAPPKPPPIQFDQAPPPALDETPDPPKEMVSRSRIKELDSIKDIADLKEAEEIIGDLMSQDVKHEALRNVASMMIDLSDITMPMPTIRMQNIRPVPTRTSHPDLKNRDQFRKALVSSFLLEPPKALQPKPFEGTD